MGEHCLGARCTCWCHYVGYAGDPTHHICKPWLASPESEQHEGEL